MPLRVSAASPLSTPALYAGPAPRSLRRMLGSSSSPSQTGPTSSRREPAHGAGGWWDHLRKADNLHLLPATSPDPSSHRQHWSTAPLRSFGRTPTPEHTGADVGSFSGVFRQNGSCKLHATSCLWEQAVPANREEGFDLHKLVQSKAEDGGVGLRARMLKSL